MAEKSVRNLTGAGMARISSRQGNQQHDQKGIPRESDDRAVGIICVRSIDLRSDFGRSRQAAQTVAFEQEIKARRRPRLLSNRTP